MTLVINRGEDDPRVHVLAIGVDNYRHLPGGADPRGLDRLGLRQLSSATPSALKMAEWLALYLNHPHARFGTLEMLLSPPQTVYLAGENPKMVNDVPNRATIRRAFDEWKDRCNTDERNVAIFYFCGHGVARQSQYLLLEDFGASENDLLENAVDARATYEGMSQCRARSQYFFIDTCREVPRWLTNKLKGGPMVLASPTSFVDRRTDSVFMIATAPGRRAFGKPKDVGRFTKSVIWALRGSGARLWRGRWQVDYAGLHTAVFSHLEANGSVAVNQSPETRVIGEAALQVFEEPPKIPITVECEPEVATGCANFALLANCGESFSPNSSGPWRLLVPADTYQLSAEFPRGEFSKKSEIHAIYPPYSPPPHDYHVRVAT
ncbi:caspase family protein [Streptomyces avermitilis]|uniref:caspase family protein n=1 Tax=Streptomyces avermitilis TaxID=33903 RepID=UPI003711F1D0